MQARDRATLAAARELMLSNCMSAAGFEYRPATLADTRADAAQAAQPYGFRSRDNVASVVRGARVSGEEASSIRVNDAYKKSLSPSRLRAFQTAFYGKPDPATRTEIKLPDGGTLGVTTGGCNGRAVKQLFGDMGEWTRLEATASYVRMKVQEEALASPEFREAASRWRACASARRVKGRNPFVAAEAGRSLSAADQERLIDSIWECQRTARLLVSADRVERAIAPRVTKAFEREILAYREKSRAALAVAQRVLSGEE